MFLPRLPHADVKLLLFAPNAARSVKGKQTQQATQNQGNKNRKKNKQGKKDDRVPSVGLSYVKLCDTAASVH